MLRALYKTGSRTAGGILARCLLAAFALFLNGFGVYLTMRAGIGAGPWDVFNLGLANTLGILYGTASISVSCTILLIDVLMKEPIGLAMIIDSLVVGKTVDLFNYLDFVPRPAHLPAALLMQLSGLVVMGYTQFLYMSAALGCGPRDTLLVGLKKRLRRIPIGAVSILLLGSATLAGYLLGGPVGIGTLVCAFLSGPVMQLAFRTVRFDATAVRHQRLRESLRVFLRREHENAA